MVDAVEVSPTTMVVNGEPVLVAVLVRHTIGATLTLSPQAWADFLAAAVRGEFDETGRVRRPGGCVGRAGR